MRTFPTARRLSVCGLAALAGLLLLTAGRPVSAAEGVVRVSDRASNQTGHTDACTTSTAGCATDACGDGCGNGCPCGSNCKCGKGCCGGNGLLGKLFGRNGKNGSNGCKCGSNCPCGKSIGHGICGKCGRHGELFGNGMCGHCCGICCFPGIPIPCLGVPVPGCFGQGAIGGCYGRVYAVNPYYHDFRDGAVYAAQGYNAPIAVPLAPNVDYQMNYGWGVPSSRMTPVSRVVPSPYGPQPTYQVPAGYTASGAMVPPAPAQ
ncbi:MAG: hypothetical protein H0T47_09700 [Planctomycetaceae bacterium]|nr:hypothetical protein [Planctomycetaceae bacterium]